MNRLKTLVVFAFLMAFGAALWADLNYPYGQIRLKLSSFDDPFPGFGSYYSTIAKGGKTILWNPATLGKLKLSEGSYSFLSSAAPAIFDYNFKKAEIGGEIEFDPGSVGKGGSYGIFFRSPQELGGSLTTQEVTIHSILNYATEANQLNFSFAHKASENLIFNFTTGTALGGDLALAGEFPVTTKAQVNFLGQKIGDMNIGTNGKLYFTYHGSGETIATYESSSTIWGNFLSQEATLPFLTYSEFRNNLSFSSPFTSTLASKFGDLSVGINIIPVSAQANLANDLRAVVPADASDLYLYVPNFDPSSEADIQDWATREARYATEAGYTRKTVKLPAGEVVGTAKYRGFYQANTVRFDLGATYDFGQWLTVGLVLENFSGSSLNFKGSGINTFLSYRQPSSEEGENLDDLFQPGGKTFYELLPNRWTTTFEVNGTPLYLEPEKNIGLPKRLRWGLALRWPWLIALDFEQNTTPISIQQIEENRVNNITISNLSFIRLGMETQFLFLPLWLRGGVTFMPKPTISGLTTEAQKSVDDAYDMVAKYGLPGFPVRIDLGAEVNLWSNLISLSLGINPQSILNALQVDITNTDLSKIIFANLTITHEPWHLSYLWQLDPSATAAAYGSKTVPAGQEKSFEAQDLKFVQTLSITYRF